MLIIDELDALPPTIKGALESEGEGDPIELARRPLRTRGGRLVAGGTPTAAAGPSRVVRLVDSCSAQFVFAVPCAACNGFTDIVWERVTWADKAEPLHECRVCSEPMAWREYAKAVQGGRWIEAAGGSQWPEPLDGGRWLDGATVRDHAGGVVDTPASIGLSIHSLYSVWTPWAEFVAQWLEATGDANRQRVFVEQCLAREFQHEREAVEAPALKAKAEHVSEPPEGARKRIVGVDVQSSHLVAVTTWWAEPQRAWIVDRREFHGGIEPDAEDSAWHGLTAYLKTTPSVVAIDIGYRQTDVLRAVRKVGIDAQVSVRPCKGVDGWHRPWFKPSRTSSGVVFGAIGTYAVKQWLIAALLGEGVVLSDALGRRLPRGACGGACGIPPGARAAFADLGSDRRERSA